MTDNVKENEVLDCPNHRVKTYCLRRLKKGKNSSKIVKLPKSETDDGLSSCSNFPEIPTLPEIEHLRGKVTEEQLKALKRGG